MTIRSRRRACSTCSPAPARSASRRSRAVRRSRCSSIMALKPARCCATMSKRSGLGGVTKVYRRDAGNLGPAHPVEPFAPGVSRSALPHEAGRESAGLVARWRLADARRRCWWSRKPRRRNLRRRKVLRSWSGAPTTTPSLRFYDLCDAVAQRSPRYRPSYPAKAGYPVFRGVGDSSQTSRRTGSPGRAGR